MSKKCKKNLFLKGDEIAKFKLGSTVVTLFSKNIFLEKLNIKDKINIGEKIANIY
ncbi:phosphatidylserine decarboxylase [endosymbiont of Sipalinus gigas]|uniref:phosphatidylserine decarboxylase n=1 Tax=endosymbiont of Sipalinus gigas TaxID=1972134 RepID=UPI00102E5859